jgi:hypothetical protein
MDQFNVIQTPHNQELQIGKRKFAYMHSEMDIDDHLSEKLGKKNKVDEELDLDGFLAEFTGEGKGILQIIQGSSEDNSTSKGSSITIEHLSSTLLSTPEFLQTFAAEGTYNKNPSLFSHYLDIKRKNQGVKKEMYPRYWG